MFIRLLYEFLERVCVVLLNGGKDLIDRIEIVDGVVNRTGESFSFGKKAECLGGTNGENVSWYPCDGG